MYCELLGLIFEDIIIEDDDCDDVNDDCLLPPAVAHLNITNNTTDTQYN